MVVEGDAVRVTDDAVLSRVAGAFAAKWDGRWQFTARDGCFGGLDGSGEAMVFSVTPVTVFAHAKGDPVRRHDAQVPAPRARGRPLHAGRPRPAG